MADNNESKGSNIGCIVLFAIVAIAYIVWTIMNTSKDYFIGLGEFTMGIIGLVAAYLIIKALSSSNKSESFNKIKDDDNLNKTINSNYSSDMDIKVNKDTNNTKTKRKSLIATILIILGIFLFFGLIYALFTSSVEVNYIIGIAVLVVLFIAAGVYALVNIKNHLDK